MSTPQNFRTVPNYDGAPRGNYQIIPSNKPGEQWALTDRDRSPLRGLTDSGAITMYRPAVHSKPSGLLERIGNRIRGESGFDWVPPATTTQQGSAASSPTTYYMTLWPQRYEKQAYIADCNNQYLSDPACFKSMNMYVEAAFEENFTIWISNKDRLGKEAQAIADDYIKMWEEDLFGYGIDLLIQGELWPQGVFKNNDLQYFLNLPAVGMERCTDDADQFIDPEKAYAQFDAVTYSNMAYFADWQIAQCRWNHVPGQKLGIPELLPVRRLARLLELQEAAKVTQVQVRAPMRYLWVFGSKDNPASPDEVRDLMALNGFVYGKRAVFDPQEVARDMFINGIGDVKAIEGDSGVGETEHLRYFLDRLCNGYPTPRALMNLGSENINRDVLRDMRAQWMTSTKKLHKVMNKPIKHFLELWWILRGINPELIDYSVEWVTPSVETDQDRVDSVVMLKQAGITSTRTSVKMIQGYTGIPDIEAELKELEKEKQMDADQQMDQIQAKGASGSEPQGKLPVSRPKRERSKSSEDAA